MRNWKNRIQIRDILDTYNEELDYNKQERDYGKIMSNRLNRYNFIPRKFSDDFLKVKTLISFNKIMDSLWDYCDDNDIWVKL